MCSQIWKLVFYRFVVANKGTESVVLDLSIGNRIQGKYVDV